MKRIKLIIGLVIVSFLACSLYAEQDELFGTRGHAGKGAAFMNSLYNPYGVSTAGAVSIFGQSSDVIFWNPAGLCRMSNPELQIGGGVLPLDRINSYLTYAKPVGQEEDKAFGFTLLNSYNNKINSYNESDNYLKQLEYMGNAFIFTYSKRLSSSIRMGINTKLLNEIADGDKSYGAGLDMGFLIVPIPIISVGLVVNNLPGLIKWENEENIEFIGSSYKLGLGYNDIKDRFSFGMIISKEYGEDAVNLDFGGEFELATFLNLRLGYYKSNFAGGLGLYFGTFDISYAYYNERFLDMDNTTHLISTTFNF